MQTEFAQLKQRSGLPFKELVKELGFSTRTLRRYESGIVTPKPPVIEVLRRIVSEQRSAVNGSQTFRLVDLFAGIGGLRIGFDAIGGSCVFTCEWNKLAQQTYRANFHDPDDHVFAGDITELAASEVPEHDVLLAGFPCQPFSIAGVSKKNALGREHGFKCEAQGTLFFRHGNLLPV